MPWHVSKARKNDKREAHVTLNRGERIWTSHVFSKFIPGSSARKNNWTCKVLAKELSNGWIEIVMVWDYPTIETQRIYDQMVCPKEVYDDLLNELVKLFSRDGNIRHDILYPQGVAELIKKSKPKV
jgi:hypothetical protein